MFSAKGPRELVWKFQQRSLAAPKALKKNITFPLECYLLLHCAHSSGRGTYKVQKAGSCHNEVTLLLYSNVLQCEFCLQIHTYKQKHAIYKITYHVVFFPQFSPLYFYLQIVQPYHFHLISLLFQKHSSCYSPESSLRKTLGHEVFVSLNQTENEILLCK